MALAGDGMWVARYRAGSNWRRAGDCALAEGGQSGDCPNGGLLLFFGEGLGVDGLFLELLVEVLPGDTGHLRRVCDVAVSFGEDFLDVDLLEGFACFLKAEVRITA